MSVSPYRLKASGRLGYALLTCRSVTKSCPTLWLHGLQHPRLLCPPLPPRVCSNYVYWVSDAIQPSHPLSSPSPPAFNLSQHQGFSNESALWIRWPKYRNFSFNKNLLLAIQGLISFKSDWFDLLEVPGTLKSLLQHHSSKASVLGCSMFFVIQLSYPHMTTGKTIALVIMDLCQQSNVSAF